MQIFPLSHLLEGLHLLVYIGLLILISQLGGRLANLLRAPRLLGYLVSGILFGPSLLGLFSETLVKEELTLITDIALILIAFSIGGALSLDKLGRLGRTVLWITVTQTHGAFFLVTALLSGFFLLVHGLPAFWSVHFPMALVIGAISAATAPAAILAIAQEYKAKGAFTTVLFGVVALDDALTILFFAFAATVAQSFVHQSAITLQNVVVVPGLSIIIAVALGLASGLCLRYLASPFIVHREVMFGVLVGFMFFTSGLAMSLKVSPLLATMMLGFVVVNFIKHLEDVFSVLETVEEPIFGVFFALAGALMDFSTIGAAWWVALLIVVGRFSGKLIGTRVGAEISRAPEPVKKYLGMALLPKAGVTVGLVLAAKAIFPDVGVAELMVNAVIGSTIINELMTPFFVRYALRKAGEVAD
jgi:Kef-type K+ transport system membrane component KefB